jgi:hypothetical protein
MVDDDAERMAAHVLLERVAADDGYMSLDEGLRQSIERFLERKAATEGDVSPLDGAPGTGT